MAAPETTELAQANLDRTNGEIEQFEAMNCIPGSMGAKYLEHLYQHQEMWARFVGQ
jgi:hypothetical protein